MKHQECGNDDKNQSMLNTKRVCLGLSSSSTSSSTSTSRIVQHIFLHTCLPIEIAKLINSYVPLCIYRFGGVDENINLSAISTMMNINDDTTTSYDVENERKYERKNWLMLSPMMSTRSNASAVMIDNRYIFVTGGLSLGKFGSDEVSSSVECYDIVTDKWSSKSRMDQPRYCHCALVATIDSTSVIFVLGGRVRLSDGSYNSYELKTCEVYNPSTDKWSFIPCMKESRVRAAAVSLNNRLYIFGGCNKTGTLSSCECYDISMSSWTCFHQVDMPTGRHSCQAIILKKEKEVYVAIMGGWDILAKSNVDTVLLYNIISNTWSMAEWKLPKVLHTFNDFSSHMIEETQQLVVVNGLPRSSECWITSFSNNSNLIPSIWTPLPSLPSPLSCTSVTSC